MRDRGYIGETLLGRLRVPGRSVPAYLWRCLILLLMLLRAGTAAAQDADSVWLVTSRGSDDAERLADAFVQTLVAAGRQQPKVLRFDADTLDAGMRRPGLIVVVGSNATQRVQAVAADTPVLHVLIPRPRYRELYPADAAPAGRRLHSALYIDQPFERQLHLCRLILPGLRRIGVLYGPASQTSADLLENAARQLGITLHAWRVIKDANPIAAMNEVLSDSQLLLALPDPEVFNRYSIAGLLLTAYHSEVPVIGFSAPYVKAGALAAVYSTPEQLGRDAAELVLAAHTGKQWTLPAPRYPAYYSVSVNRQVARSFGLTVPDDEQLQRALQQLEQVRQ